MRLRISPLSLPCNSLSSSIFAARNLSARFFSTLAISLSSVTCCTSGFCIVKIIGVFPALLISAMMSSVNLDTFLDVSSKIATKLFPTLSAALCICLDVSSIASDKVLVIMSAVSAETTPKSFNNFTIGHAKPYTARRTALIARSKVNLTTPTATAIRLNMVFSFCHN